MKKMFLFVAAIAILAACSKKGVNDETLDKWNGYSNLKDGELVQTLWAGQHDSAGYVTYGIDEDANFYATYTTVDGWEMSETHFFAGDKGLMPLNKPGNPKIGKFPYKDSFNPPVTEVTYTIELIQLPQAEVDGFVAAAHAVAAWAKWRKKPHGVLEIILLQIKAGVGIRLTGINRIRTLCGYYTFIVWIILMVHFCSYEVDATNNTLVNTWCRNTTKWIISRYYG